MVDESGEVLVDPTNAHVTLDAEVTYYADAGEMDPAERDFLARRVRAYADAAGGGRFASRLTEDGSLDFPELYVRTGVLREGDEVRVRSVLERGPDGDPVVSGGGPPGRTGAGDLQIASVGPTELLSARKGDLATVFGLTGIGVALFVVATVVGL